MTRLRILSRASSLSVCLALTASCSDGRVVGYATPVDGTVTDALTSLSDLERAILIKDFGRLPSVAPRDVSNAVAGDGMAANLGRALFFDARYSLGGSVACATCHIPGAGFQDNRGNTSRGVDFTERHAPSVLNAAFGSAEGAGSVWQLWDGRKDSLWAQALSAPENAVEMGGSRSRVALLIYDKYRVAYEAAFPKDSPMPKLRDASGAALIDESGNPHAQGAALQAWQKLTRDNPALGRAVTRVYVNFGKAIAAYESRLISRNSRFDQFRDSIGEGYDGGNHLTASELRGLKLFVGKAGCSSCHRGPNLTDGKFHNIGIAQTGPHVPAVDRGRADGLLQVKDDEFNCRSEWSDVPDPKACAVWALDASDARVQAGLGAFKTPTLRDVARTAPYFHTGNAASLFDVVNHYANGGDQGGFQGTLDENLGPLRSSGLTELEKHDLVDFMSALDGEPLPDQLTQPPELPK